MIDTQLHRMAGVAIALTVFASIWTSAAAQGRRRTADLARGREVYLTQCAVCHGAEGRGDGAAAYLVSPKPRDFTRGLFKLRSTPSIPTDADLLRTIIRGIPGTAMPGWPGLIPADRQALVEYIKSLSPAFAQPAKPVKIPRAPRFTPKMAAAGRQLYVDAGCDACHGPAGHGDGPSAAELKDEWGYPIHPRDLARPELFKRGSTPQDLYKTIQVGFGGTPMPLFGDTLTEKQSWEIVAYLRSLARAPAKAAAANRSVLITARRSPTAVDPADPFDRVWERAAPAEVALMTLWAREKTVRSLRVRALYTKSDLALCIEWDDPTADLTTSRPQAFADAVAAQFPVGKKTPGFTMGEKGAGVNIWYWRAGSGKKALADSFAEAYPHLAIDDYPLGSDPIYATARAVGNGLDRAGSGSGLSEMNAEGFGTLTAQPEEDQQIRGSGVWREGRWRVVMVRPFRTGSSLDRQLTPGETVPVAFAVWDGAQGDRNGQKAVSIWQRLRFEKGR